MNREAKSIFSVTFLILGLFLMTNSVTNEESTGNNLLLAVIFFVLAAAFYYWLYRQSLEEAEATALQQPDPTRGLDAGTRTLYNVASAAQQRVREAVEETDVDRPDIAGETVDADEAFAAGANRAQEIQEQADLLNTSQPNAFTKDEIGESPAEAVAGAQNGDPIAESEIADAEAAKPSEAGDFQVPPDVAPEERAVEEQIQSGTTAADAPVDELNDDQRDLTAIEGIGPTYRDILESAGITTFAQLAALSKEEIEQLVKDNGGRRSASMATWAEQARLAADGKWDELAKLQDEFSGGRRDGSD